METTIAHNNEPTFELRCDNIPVSEIIGIHSHSNWELNYVKRGSGLHVLNGLTEPCNEGEVILVPPHVAHQWIISPTSTGDDCRMENFSLSFKSSVISTRLKGFPEIAKTVSSFIADKMPVEITGDSAQRLRELILRMAHLDESMRLPVFIQTLLEIASSNDKRAICIQMQPCGNQRSITILQDVQLFILNNYSRRITLEEVAASVAMSKTAFCNFFKRHYSQNFFYALNEHRINAACLMLCKKPFRSISEIGFSVGFNDIPYFHRTFKRYKGCTPSEYRKKTESVNIRQQ